VDAPKGPEAILPAPEKSAAVNSVPETATLESPAPTPETATTQFNTDSIPNAPVMADAQKTEAPAPLLAMSQTDSENANIDPAAAPEIVKPVSVKKVHHHQTHTRKLASTTPVVDSQPAPVVPTQPVTVAGKTLNRYYFVRQGDTAEAISNRLYGNLQKLTDLIAWNGNQVTWKPGKVILYLSASNPEDVTMQSYFDEQSLGAEPYTLHKGETLEKLAQARYGNGASWGEIAVLNKIADLSHAKNGQHLRLFPASLPLKPLVEPIASTEIPVVVAKPAPEVMPTPVPRAPVEKPALANPEVTSVFGSHHLGVAALLAAASVLMFAFFLVRRRKSRADHSDF
jgi:nucleoid-associated protein YgaU